MMTHDPLEVQALATAAPLVSAMTGAGHVAGPTLVETWPIESRAMHALEPRMQATLGIEWVETLAVVHAAPPVQVATRPSRLPTTQ